MKVTLPVTGLLLLIALGSHAQEGQPMRSSATRVINGDTFCVHEVKRKQTLYSIARTYQVEMQEVIDRNPEIRNGLKTGQVLLIPCPSERKPVPQAPVIPEPLLSDPSDFGHSDSLSGERNGKRGFPARNAPCYQTDTPSRQTFRVALMMHLYLKDAGSLLTGETPDLTGKGDISSFRYIQFYEGFRLAVDSLQSLGMNVTLYVYDVEPGTNNVHQILNRPEMKQMDLIVGMLFHRDFLSVASWANDHHIPLVSPISERDDQVEGNPAVIKVRPPGAAAVGELVSHLSREYPYAHTLIVRSWEPEVRTIAEQIYTEGVSRGLDIAVVGEDQLTSQLLRGAENVVVVATEQKPFAMSILSKLNADTALSRISLFGLPRWDLLEGLDFEYLEKSRAHFVLPFFIDYGNPDTEPFIWKFQQTYRTDPDVIAFQGYDVAWYFLSALQKFGPQFQECLPGFRLRPMLSAYHFTSNPGNGWENRYWVICRFADYSLERID